MQKLALIFSVSACALLAQSCSTHHSAGLGTSQLSTKAPLAEQKSPEFIETEGYRFKLEPDVQADGTAHLDFYVRDLSNAHVKGVTGNFRVTKPDGSKTTIPVVEEKPHDHYHGILKLDQAGEYMIVGQVSVGGKKLNPRFSLSQSK